MKQDSKFIVVGKILSPFGIKGHLKIFISQDYKKFVKDKISNLEFSTKNNSKLKFKFLFEKKDFFYFSEENTKDRNAAEKLSSTELMIPRELIPKLDEDEYLYSDLVGLDVIDESENKIGNIISVNNFGAGDVVDIKFLDGTREFLPFKKEVFLEIRERFARIKMPKYL
jgi:16S rRNA processing protein RimM